MCFHRRQMSWGPRAFTMGAAPKHQWKCTEWSERDFQGWQCYFGYKFWLKHGQLLGMCPLTQAGARWIKLMTFVNFQSEDEQWAVIRHIPSKGPILRLYCVKHKLSLVGFIVSDPLRLGLWNSYLFRSLDLHYDCTERKLLTTWKQPQ